MLYVGNRRRRKVVMVRGVGVGVGVEAENKKRRDRLWGEIKEEGKNNKKREKS
jgi:hypothetical protein